MLPGTVIGIAVANLVVILFSARALFLLIYCRRHTFSGGYLDQFQIWTDQTVSVKSCRYLPTFFTPAMYEEIEFLLDGKEYKIRTQELIYGKGKEVPLAVRSAFWKSLRRWNHKETCPVKVES